MPNNKLVVELDLDSTDFDRGFNRATVRVQQFGRATNDTGRILDRNNSAIGRLADNIRRLSLTTFAMIGAVRILDAVFLSWGRAILNASGELERMEVLLQGLSTSATQDGRIADAQRDMQFLFDTAQSAPFSLGALTSAAVKLRVGGFEPTTGALTALTDAVARFGGNDQNLLRGAVALQQLGSKTVVSMEELRQQLGESVPDAIRAMARGLGVTVQALSAEIARGTVSSQVAVNAMLDEWSRSHAGAGDRLVQTWSGAISRLRTQWLLFVSSIGGDQRDENSLLGTATAALNELITAFDSTEVQNFAITVGRAMSQVVRGIVAATKFIAANIDTISNLVQLLGALFGIRLVSSMLKATVGMRRFGAATDGSLIRPLTRLSSLIGPIGLVIQGLTGHLLGMTRGMSRAQTGLKQISGLIAGLFPLGRVLKILLGALAAAWVFMGDEGEEAMEKLRDGMNLTAEEADRALDEIGEDAERILELNETIARRQGIADAREGRPDSLFGNFNRNQLRDAREELAILTEQQVEDTRLATLQLQKIIEQQGQALAREYLSSGADVREAASTAYDDITQQAEQDFANNIITPDEYQSILTDAAVDHHEEVVISLNKAVSDLTSAANGIDEDNTRALEANLRAREIINKRISDATAQRQDEESRAASEQATRLRILGQEQADAIASANAKVSDQLTTLRNRILSIRADIAGEASRGEEILNTRSIQEAFKELEDAGESTANLRNEILGLSEELHDSEEALRVHRAGQTALQNVQKVALTTANDLRISNEKAAGTYSELSERLADGEVRFARMRLAAKGAEEAIAAINAQQEEYNRSLFVMSANDAERQLANLRDTLLESSNPRQAAIDNQRRTLEALQREDQLRANATQAERDAHARRDVERQALLTEQLRNETRTGLARTVAELQPLSTQLSESMTGWIQDFSSELADTLISGEGNFEDFAEGIIKNIARMVIEFVTLQAVLRSLNALGFEEFAGAGVPNLAGSSGGVAGRVSSLASNLVGRAVSPSLNIVNNSNAQIANEGNGSSVNFDPSRSVVDIVIGEAVQPGPFRDTVRSIV